jgi:RNA polymerase sigma-70 factor (ECF subfamily)
MSSEQAAAMVPTPPRERYLRDSREEASLLEAYRSGEREALRLVEKWIQSGVVRSTQEFIRDRADVVQEVHLRILTNLHRGTFRGDSTFKTYVYGVTRYTSLGLLREKRKYLSLPQRELTSREANPHQALAAAEKASRLATALRELPDKQRRLYNLLYRQGLDYETVGRELGVPIGTVKSRASRFRAKLSRRLSGPVRPLPPASAQGQARTRLRARRRERSEA